VAISESNRPAAADGPASFQQVSVGRQALLRELNDRLRARLIDEQEFQFSCECGRASCRDALLVKLDVYETLRRVPTHFLMKHSHAGPDERVVASHDEFLIIEKYGPDAIVAIRLARAKHRLGAPST